MAKGISDGAKAARKSILLFSDGTGNSSAKLQKTNVWRLYEAIDLGDPVNGTSLNNPADTGDIQIAYYDDGVGTSSFRLLAALGGIFGFGLSRNVRDLYKFLCRNYQPGDRIYAFGFSRGAYTIRLLVSLVTSMGLVPYTSEAELEVRTNDVWREFRRNFHTNNPVSDWLVALGRACNRLVRRGWRKLTRGVPYGDAVPYARAPWHREWRAHWRVRKSDQEPACLPTHGPEIEFVGVWDTVAAYGGPIIEITRAIDEWIWPLTMPDYRLSPRVKCARHALSIDDKRDAFHPLLWDEVSECADPARADRTGRIQQVWFAGMHADVGGGYSDEALAFVSLAWMIEHAEKAGLRLLPKKRDDVFLIQNVYGPIHDSRSGGGVFYRYQPRYINAWLEYPHAPHVRPLTQIYRDPTIDGGRYRRHGLIHSPILLHKSVEQRLRFATDGYGPINLPKDYLIDDGVRGLAKPSVNPPPVDDLYELGDRIKLRRVWYFASFLLAMLIAIKPWWDSIPLLGSLSGAADSRTSPQQIEVALNAFLPEFAGKWTNAFAADPLVTLGLFAAWYFTTRSGAAQEVTMADIARRVWKHRFGPKVTPAKGAYKPPAAKGPLLAVMRFMRASPAIQWAFAEWKWRAVPVVLGFAIWLFNWYAAGAILTQASLVSTEMNQRACPADPPGGKALPMPAKAGEVFTIDAPLSNPCFDLGRYVQSGQTYHVTIDASDWMDASQTATPEGWDKGGFIEWASLPYRRVVSAPLFAPVFETRIHEDRDGGKRRFGDGIYMLRPALHRVAGTQVWEGTLEIFDFPADGPRRDRRRNLHFFVNDAAAPLWKVRCPDPADKGCHAGWTLFPLRAFYANNRGTARITMRVEDGDTIEREAFERRVDRRLRQRCPGLHEVSDCRKAFSDIETTP